LSHPSSQKPFLSTNLKLQIVVLPKRKRLRAIQDIDGRQWSGGHGLSLYSAVLTNRRVTGLKANEALVMDKKTKKVDTLPFGVCVWSTGWEGERNFLNSEVVHTASFLLTMLLYMIHRVRDE